MVILADALDPNKKGVGAAQGSCLGDYMAVAIERWNGATDFAATCFFFYVTPVFHTVFFGGWHFETWKKQRDGKASSFAYNPIASHRSHRPGSNILWSWSFFVLWHCKLIWPSPIWNKQLASLKLFLTGTIRRQARNMMTSLELLCLWPENIGIFHVFCFWIFSGLCLGMGFLEQKTDMQIHQLRHTRLSHLNSFKCLLNLYSFPFFPMLILFPMCQNCVSTYLPVGMAKYRFDDLWRVCLEMREALSILPIPSLWNPWRTLGKSVQLSLGEDGELFPWILISLVLHAEVNASHMILLLVAWTIRQLWVDFVQCWDSFFFDLPWLSRRAPPNQIINPFSLRHRYAVIQCRKCWDETVVFFCTNQPTGLRHPKLIQLSSSYWCVCVWKLWSF